MAKIIYVPLEHIPGRYTVHMDRDIMKHFSDNNIPMVKIYPEAAGTAGPYPQDVF